MSLKRRISQVLPRQEDQDASGDMSQPAAAVLAPASVVTPEEQEWALVLHQRLVKVMDLSLITTMEEVDARKQIHEVSRRLIAEESMTLNEVSANA